MRALSIRQPWASMIVGGPLSAGCKITENRSASTAGQARQLVGHRVAIHAPAKFDKAGLHRLLHKHFGFERAELPYGRIMDFPRSAIVGVATVVRVFDRHDAITDDEARFYTGDYGIAFDDRRFLEPIVDVGGALGFWSVPADLEVAISQRLGEQP